MAAENGKTYLKTLITAGLIISLSVVSINAFVDPYGILGAPEIQGFNRIKPQIPLHTRMVKAHKINKIRPKGLILGSSRAEVGLNPDHPGWAASSRPVYNAALPSARIYEIYHYLRHAHSQTSIAQVVLILDFFSFDTGRRKESGFETERLRLEPGLIPNTGMIKDISTVLFSYDSLQASIDTLNHQNKPFYWYLSNGSRDAAYLQQQIEDKGGHFKAFESVLTSALTAEDGLVRFDYGHGNGKKTDVLKWFQNLVLFCAEEQIELYALISPIHSQRLELLWQLGLWPTYEQWKRDVTHIIEEIKKKGNLTTRIELWDFSGFNEISMERVPGVGNVLNRMDWYWEASHYKRRTGDLMLDRVLMGKRVDNIPEFGVRISIDGIESHLKAIRQQRQRYAQARPEETEYLNTLIKDTLAL